MAQAQIPLNPGYAVYLPTGGIPPEALVETKDTIISSVNAHRRIPCPQNYPRTGRSMQRILNHGFPGLGTRGTRWTRDDWSFFYAALADNWAHDLIGTYLGRTELASRLKKMLHKRFLSGRGKNPNVFARRAARHAGVGQQVTNQIAPGHTPVANVQGPIGQQALPVQQHHQPQAGQQQVPTVPQLVPASQQQAPTVHHQPQAGQQQMQSGQQSQATQSSASLPTTSTAINTSRPPPRAVEQFLSAPTTGPPHTSQPGHHQPRSADNTPDSTSDSNPTTSSESPKETPDTEEAVVESLRNRGLNPGPFASSFRTYSQPSNTESGSADTHNRFLVWSSLERRGVSILN